MLTPEVSVIIPTCNREEMLLRALRSVKAQTYLNYEVIIVDDGSTDNTQNSIIRMHDQNINYFRYEISSGTSAKPRNAGLKKARGKYIAFLDDDDEWLPTLLEKLTEKIKILNEKVGVVYCGIMLVDTKGIVLRMSHPMLRGTLWPRMLVGPVGTLSSSLIRRECFNKVGLFDVQEAGTHGDMWVRLAKHYDFDYVPDILTRYHIHENQMSNTRKPIIGREVRLKKYADDYKRHPAERRVVRSGIGLLYLEKGDRLKGVKYLPDIMLHNHCSLNFYLTLVLMFISPRLLQRVVDLKRRFIKKDLHK